MSASVEEVTYEGDRSVDTAPKLSEEELHKLQDKQAALDKLFADSGQAKYKIELFFAHTRRATGLSAGALSIWESGTKLHGGGDAKMYWCPSLQMKKGECTGIIPDASNGYGHLVCPKCQHVWKGDEVIGEVFYKLEPRKWAEVLVKHYAALGHNADIYMKFPKYDLRDASSLEQAKQQMGDKLSVVRSQRVLVMYPLKNIIKDTGRGSDLLTLFHSFLTA